MGVNRNLKLSHDTRSGYNFTKSRIRHRGFALSEVSGDCSGSSVSTAGDVNGDGVVDLIIGAPQKYDSDVGISYVVFGDIPPTLVQNCLTLHSGSKVSLNSTFLSAYDRNNNNNTIVFVPTNITHGHFELMSKPGVAVTNFTQSQLVNSNVQFVHDGVLLRRVIILRFIARELLGLGLRWQILLLFQHCLRLHSRLLRQ